MIKDNAGRRYRGVSRVPARLFPSFAARPDTVRATPDPVHPFTEPTYSPAHPPPATSVNPRFIFHLSTPVQQSLILSYSLYCALRIAYTHSRV
jgi:hypothetical protein